MINGLKIDLTRNELIEHLTAVSQFWAVQRGRIEKMLGQQKLSPSEAQAYNRAVLQVDFSRAKFETMANHLAVDDVAAICGDDTTFRFDSEGLAKIEYPLEQLRKDVLTDDELKMSVLGQAKLQDALMQRMGGAKESVISDLSKVDGGWS